MNDALLVKVLDKFAGVNWCKAIVDDLRESVRNWNKKNNTTKSISGCTAFVLVSYTVILFAAFSILYIDKQ